MTNSKIVFDGKYSIMTIRGMTVMVLLLSSIIPMIVNTVVGQTVPCYMCGNDSLATLSNGTALINLTGLPGIPAGVTVVPCSLIFDTLKAGATVNRSTCDLLLTTPDVVTLLQQPCGCSKISTFTTAPAVAGAPTNAPVVAVVPTNVPVVAVVPTNAPVAVVTIAPVVPTIAPVVPTIAPTAAKIVTTAPVVVVVPVPTPLVPPSVRHPTAASLRQPVERDHRSNDNPQPRPTSRESNNRSNDNPHPRPTSRNHDNDNDNDNDRDDNDNHKPQPKPKPKPVPSPVKETNRISEKKPVKAFTTSAPTITSFPTRTFFPSADDAARSAEVGGSNTDSLNVDSIAQLSVSLDYSNLYEREYDIASTSTTTKKKNDVVKN